MGIAISCLKDGDRYQLFESNRNDWITSVTVRDEWRKFRDRLTLAVGVRFEHNVYTGPEWQPEVRLSFDLRKNHTFWASWSRAVRLPSRVEHDLIDVPFAQTTVQGVRLDALLQGNRNLISEVAREWAGGYRTQHKQLWSLDINAFHTNYSRLVSFELGRRIPTPGVPFGTSFLQFVPLGNGRYGVSRGVEITATRSVHRNWKLHGSYSFLDEQQSIASGSKDPFQVAYAQSPRHQLKARSYWNLGSRLQLDATAFAVDKIAYYNIPGYLRLDLRLGYKPRRNQDISLIVQDAAGHTRQEYLATLFAYSVPSRRNWILRWMMQF